MVPSRPVNSPQPTGSSPRNNASGHRERIKVRRPRVLIAAGRNDRFVWALHRRLLEQGNAPSVPSTVLAQSWRGGPQPQLLRLLAGCEVKPRTETQARVAGSLLAQTRTTDIVDASVVIVARERGDQVLTSDPDDLGPYRPRTRHRAHNRRSPSLTHGSEPRSAATRSGDNEVGFGDGFVLSDRVENVGWEQQGNRSAVARGMTPNR